MSGSDGSGAYESCADETTSLLESGGDRPKALASFATADSLGLLAALGSGTLFALEGMLAQTCFRQINPATFTSLVFTVKWLVLSGFALLIIHVQPQQLQVCLTYIT